MGGILKIQQQRESEKEAKQSVGAKDLYLRDGDQAFIAIIPSGEENDARLDSLAFHSVKETFDSGKAFWKSYVCPTALDENATCRLCDSKVRKSLQFIMWVYVYYVMHTFEREGWTPEKTATGAQRYKEDVNDFRILIKGFGKGDYLWNQVTDIYNEQGALNKLVVRFKRTGAGMSDTSYSFLVTNKAVAFDASVQKRAKELPLVAQYATEVFALPNETDGVVDVRQRVPVEEDDEDLF